MSITQEDKAMIGTAFDRVATFLVEHSEQADRLVQLEGRVNELHDSLTRYREDNGKLRSDLWQTTQQRNQYERELGEARTASETMGRRNHELRETVHQYSAEIESLKVEIQRLGQALANAESTVGYQSGRIASLEDELKRQVAKADEYFAEAVRYEDEAKQAKDRLAKVQEALGVVQEDMPKVDPSHSGGDTTGGVGGTGSDPAHAPLPHEAWPAQAKPQEAPQNSGPIAGPFEAAAERPSDEVVF